MWQLYAAIAAAASDHLGTTMAARSQKAPGMATPLSVSKIQADNIGSNYSNLPYARVLAEKSNDYAVAQKKSLLNQAIPGYGTWEASQAAKANDLASGKLSTADEANLVRRNAENAYSSGIFGQANDYSLLRDYGQAQYQGLSEAQSIMNGLDQLNNVDLTSVSSWFTSMDDAFATAENNRSAEQAWMNADQAAKNIRKAAPWVTLSQTGKEYAAWKSGDSNYAKEGYANNAGWEQYG